MRVKVSTNTARMVRIFKTKTEGVHELVVDEIFNEIYDNTPVDTGLAQAEWTKLYFKTRTIISNPVPYMVYLNEGHSQQAPALFIERSAEEGKARALAMARTL